jgi:hypothetical protein
MAIIKKFELFKEEFDAQPQRSNPSKPDEVITEPTTKPGTRPMRPSPIRRDKPGVSPDPKAKKPKEGKIEDVIERYKKITNQK